MPEVRNREWRGTLARVTPCAGRHGLCTGVLLPPATQPAVGNGRHRRLAPEWFGSSAGKVGRSENLQTVPPLA